MNDPTSSINPDIAPFSNKEFKTFIVSQDNKQYKEGTFSFNFHFNLMLIMK